ncbi:hypothetical protein HK102_008212 [Quaeritorhiza haematococci]|nr:hypothetical protein HK102_008212 [Quaeritorhiza haematococci]
MAVAAALPSHSHDPSLHQHHYTHNHNHHQQLQLHYQQNYHGPHSSPPSTYGSELDVSSYGAAFVADMLSNFNYTNSTSNVAPSSGPYQVSSETSQYQPRLQQSAVARSQQHNHSHPRRRKNQHHQHQPLRPQDSYDQSDHQSQAVPRQSFPPNDTGNYHYNNTTTATATTTRTTVTTSSMITTTTRLDQPEERGVEPSATAGSLTSSLALDQLMAELPELASLVVFVVESLWATTTQSLVDTLNHLAYHSGNSNSITAGAETTSPSTPPASNGTSTPSRSPSPDPATASSFYKFVRRLLKAANLSTHLILLALLYVARLRKACPNARLVSAPHAHMLKVDLQQQSHMHTHSQYSYYSHQHQYSNHHHRQEQQLLPPPQYHHQQESYDPRLLTTASLILAQKTLDDHRWTNRTWANLASLPLSDINNAEMDLLAKLDYKLHSSIQDFEAWGQAVRQFGKDLKARLAEARRIQAEERAAAAAEAELRRRREVERQQMEIERYEAEQRRKREEAERVLLLERERERQRQQEIEMERERQLALEREQERERERERQQQMQRDRERLQKIEMARKRRLSSWDETFMGGAPKSSPYVVQRPFNQQHNITSCSCCQYQPDVAPPQQPPKYPQQHQQLGPETDQRKANIDAMFGLNNVSLGSSPPAPYDSYESSSSTVSSASLSSVSSGRSSPSVSMGYSNGWNYGQPSLVQQTAPAQSAYSYQPPLRQVQYPAATDPNAMQYQPQQQPAQAHFNRNDPYQQTWTPQRQQLAAPTRIPTPSASQPLLSQQAYSMYLPNYAYTIYPVKRLRTIPMPSQQQAASVYPVVPQTPQQQQPQQAAHPVPQPPQPQQQQTYAYAGAYPYYSQLAASSTPTPSNQQQYIQQPMQVHPPQQHAQTVLQGQGQGQQPQRSGMYSASLGLGGGGFVQPAPVQQQQPQQGRGQAYRGVYGGVLEGSVGQSAYANGALVDGGVGGTGGDGRMNYVLPIY